MTKVPSVAPIFMAFFLLLQQPATSTGPTLKKEAYLQACSLAQTLQALPGLAALQTTTSKESLNNLEEAAGKLSAVAEADTNADEALVIFAVAAELKKHAASEAALRLTEAAESIREVATTQTVAGGIIEFYHMLSVAASGSAGGCLNDGTDGTTLVTDRSKLTGCTFGVPIFDAKPRPDIAEHVTANGFSALKGTNVKEAGTGSNKCVLFQQGTAAATKLFQKEQQFKLAGGTLTINTDASVATATVKGETINTGGTTGRTDLLQAAHTDAKKIIAKGKAPTAEDAKAATKKIVLGPQLKTALAKLLQKLDGADSGEGYAAKAATAIDGVFGAKAAEFDSKWTAFMKTNVEGSKDKGTTEVQVSSLANFKEITDVLLYYRAKDKLKTASLQKEIKELKKANNVATKQTETDATCEKKGTGDNCKDGCKWDSDGPNKKCVVDKTYTPKQGEGAKESVTATNTTGSNSFLINKAPLWLAFLLF